MVAARENILDADGENARIRIYIGEDKRHSDQPLDEVSVLLYPPIPDSSKIQT